MQLRIVLPLHFAKRVEAHFVGLPSKFGNQEKKDKKKKGCLLFNKNTTMSQRCSHRENHGIHEINAFSWLTG